jgi:hypothetical protein
MKHILPFAIALLPFAVNAQRFHADMYAGLANYEGDLQGNRFAFTRTFTDPLPAAGLGLSYDLTNKFIVRFAANYARINADDKNNNSKSIQSRNLNFKTNIFEGQLAVEYNLFDLSERGFTPYVFAGVAAYHFNPYSSDSMGNKVYLRPLSTEGEGLAGYPDKKPYGLTQFAIPFGGGLKLAISEKIQLGLELGLRKLFTDYLDDVSTTYVDSSTLYAARGPQSVAFAFRGNEIHGESRYPNEGAIRGNPKNKDWYYLTSFRISYLLFSNRNSESRKSKMGCPKSVY